MEWITDEFGNRRWQYVEADRFGTKTWVINWWHENAQPECHTEDQQHGGYIDVDVVDGHVYIQHEAGYDGLVTVTIPFVVMAAFMEAMKEVKPTSQP